MFVICVLCLIVVPLPPGKNPFALKINNNINNRSSIPGNGRDFSLLQNVQNDFKAHPVFYAKCTSDFIGNLKLITYPSHCHD
jgi:hypothetical protein